MIFVTGGTGLIGAHLLLKLVQEGHTVTALKRETSDLEPAKRVFEWYAPGQGLFDRINWVDGHLGDVFRLNDLMANAKQVYHCAAMVSFVPSDRKQLLEANIDGTANVVNAALDNKVEKFCFVSSTAAIGGKNKGETVTEEVKWESDYARSDYAISKHYGEREVWRGAAEGLKVVIVNPCVVLGPGAWGKSSTSLIRTVWKGLRFFTTGSNAFVDARDVAKAMVGLMKSDIHSQRFLVVSENMAYKDFFDLVANTLSKNPPKIKASRFSMEILWRLEWLLHKAFGRKPVVTKPTAESAYLRKWYSNEKIKEALGMEFIPVAQSVKDTCAIFLDDVKHGRVR